MKILLMMLSLLAGTPACSSGTLPELSGPTDGSAIDLDAGPDGNAPDAAPPERSPTHDCKPSCGAGNVCNGSGGCGIRPPDGGECAPTPASCVKVPPNCGGVPTCDCLLNGLCSGSGTCAINADGDWLIGCLRGSATASIQP